MCYLFTTLKIAAYVLISSTTAFRVQIKNARLPLRRTIVPKAATWNAGGGGPKPEFLGGDWMFEDNQFWDEAEKMIGSAALELAGADRTRKGYDFSRYSHGSAALKGLPGSNGEGTVGELLAGLPEAAEKFGLDYSKWICYERLRLADVFKHAFGSKGSEKITLFSGEGQCKDELYKDFYSTSTFKAPDGCYKNRASRFAVGSNFKKLLSASSDPDFWEIWIGGMAGSKWGPGTICSIAGEKTILEMMKTPQTTHEGDWIAMAIWDRFSLSMTRACLNGRLDSIGGHAGTPSHELAGISVIEEMSKAQESTAVLEKIRVLSQSVDVLLLQEPPKELEETFKDTHDFVGADDAENGFDAVVMVRKRSNDTDWKGVDNSRSDLAIKELRNLQSSYVIGWTGKAARKAKKFWVTEADAYSSVAVADGILYLSIHSDTDGFYCVKMLEVAKKLADSLELPALVGMDSNIQPFPKPPKNGLSDLLSAAKDLGLKPIMPNDKDITYTVWKTRSFAQAQIHKAAKVDKTMKDWLFWYPGKTGVTDAGNAFVVNHFEKNVGSYRDRMFPTQSFPADHAIVTTHQGFPDSPGRATIPRCALISYIMILLSVIVMI